MKKQILFLTMITLALVFAGTSKTFGQLDPSTQTIDPLSCVTTSEPLHPFAGVEYWYSLDGWAGEDTAATYTWWATKDVDFITDVVDVAGGMLNTNFGTRLVSPDVIGSSTYGVTTAYTTAGADSVGIMWSSSVLAGTDYQNDPGPGTATFVVGYAEGLNCADNIQVYEINPLPNFTIDIAAIDPSADTTLNWDDQTTAELCVDFIQSAVYQPGTNDLLIDHGTNYLYFEVAASNFVNDWTPTFTLDQTTYPGLQGTQTAVVELYPTLADAQGGTNMITSNAGSDWTSAGGTWATGQQLTATDPLNIGSGVSVYVRVVITNSTWESLTSSPFVLAVDAQDDNETGIWDMDDADCGVDPTTIVADQDDLATVTVLPRPTLNHNTDDSGTPNPTNRVPKVDGDGTEYPRF